MRSPDALRKLAVAMALATALGTVQAADECRVTITHLGDGAARRPLLTTVAVLSVGDVTRQEIDWLEALRNDGPHDVHVTLSGAPNRQLRRGQVDPAQGRYGSRVRLLRLECLTSRSAATTPSPAHVVPNAAIAADGAPAPARAPVPHPINTLAERPRADAHHPR
jgi:hypothetical protein